MRRSHWKLVGLAGLAALAGCATPSSTPSLPDVGQTPWALSSQLVLEADPAVAPPAWFHQQLPGKSAVDYRYERRDGRDTLAAAADGAASLVRHRVHIAPDKLGRLRFSWLVPQLMDHADLGRSDASDSPVRIVLAFDGDRSRLSPRDALLAELIHSLTGEQMPYATLMYVWCRQRPAGSVIENPRTGRMRKLVVESGTTGLNRWLDYEQDIRADFRRAFGEEPGALIGVAIMTDSDNTGAIARAWYGPLRLLPVRHVEP